MTSVIWIVTGVAILMIAAGLGWVACAMFTVGKMADEQARGCFVKYCDNWDPAWVNSMGNGDKEVIPAYVRGKSVSPKWKVKQVAQNYIPDSFLIILRRTK